MRYVLFVTMLACSLLGAGCDRGSDASSSLHFTNAGDQQQFVDALAKAGIEHRIDVREGEKWVSWAKKDGESVERIRADLMVPPGRNLSLTPGEDQEQFKKWLRDSGIPFKTRISLGQEYVVWAEEDTERVKKWPHWTEPPSEKSSRP